GQSAAGALDLAECRYAVAAAVHRRWRAVRFSVRPCATRAAVGAAPASRVAVPAVPRTAPSGPALHGRCVHILSPLPTRPQRSPADELSRQGILPIYARKPFGDR